MNRDRLIRAASRNNAESCAVMSQAHRLVGEFGTQGDPEEANLDVAVRHGIQALGPLRVWQRHDPHHALLVD